MIIKDFSINFNLIEVQDAYDHALKYKIDVILEHDSGVLEYQASDLWFDFENWDSFRTALFKPTKEELTLIDQSQYFSFGLKIQYRVVVIYLSIKKPLFPRGEASLKVETEVDLDSSFLEELKNQFKNVEIKMD